MMGLAVGECTHTKGHVIHSVVRHRAEQMGRQQTDGKAEWWHLEELVLQQLSAGWPESRVLLQALLHNVMELLQCRAAASGSHATRLPYCSEGPGLARQWRAKCPGISAACSWLLLLFGPPDSLCDAERIQSGIPISCMIPCYVMSSARQGQDPWMAPQVR